MRIIDGWYVNILLGRTWGFSWVSILFIIIGVLAFLAAYNAKEPSFAIISLYILAAASFLCAGHAKPVEKIVTEYKIECDDTAKVNDFFNRFELQEVVDETHYIVRQKDWRDFN